MVRATFARWWLSGFLASFGDGLRLAAFPLLAASVTRVAAGMRVQMLLGVVPLLMAAGAL